MNTVKLYSYRKSLVDYRPSVIAIHLWRAIRTAMPKDTAIKLAIRLIAINCNWNRIGPTPDERLFSSENYRAP